MAEINAQWSNEDPSPSPNSDAGFEEVTEDEANSSMSGLSNSDPANHSLPAPEPRKGYNDRHQAEIRKRRRIIWGVAALLIVGVIGAFVGGFVAGKEPEAESEASRSHGVQINSEADFSSFEAAQGGGGGQQGGNVANGSFRYRRTRRLTKKRRRVNVRGSDQRGSAEKNNFDLAQVFGA